MKGNYDCVIEISRPHENPRLSAINSAFYFVDGMISVTQAVYAEKGAQHRKIITSL